MDPITENLPDQSTIFFYLVVIFSAVGALYLYDMFYKVNCYKDTKIINYGYEPCNGPATWKNSFTNAGGQKQSPINLQSYDATEIAWNLSPLQFSEDFGVLPYEMKLYNSGTNVVLYGKWCGCIRPTLTGGPLENDNYKFLHIKFRWGQNDDEGSEHMINTKLFAMEMQVSFVKQEYQKCDVLEAARMGAILVLSYLFMVTPIENPFLEPIVLALKYIKLPLGCAMICPFPLQLLSPAFHKNYFSYEGSLTFPPCTEGVKWIVQTEPLAISKRQIKKFRKLLGCNFMPLTTNCRPVECVNGREVMYYT